MKNLWKGLIARLTRRTTPVPPARSGTAGTRPVPAPPRRATSVHAETPSGRHLSYAPNPDGDADPGEIVWTWVPYEDDPGKGKDRPVLIVGRDGHVAIGLMLSSQSERDGQRNWLALGPGAWDREARPSWLRLDRVLRMPEDSIRREGAVLDKKRFVRVADILRRSYGWE